MDSAQAPGPISSGNVPSGKLLSYEVHFFRADGTLSLRLHTAALGQEEVMRAMAKMRTGEFVEVKIWRGLDRAVVRHKPAIPQPEPDQPAPR